MITLIIAIIFVIIFIIYALYGGFYTISFNISKCGGETLAFLPHKGDYKQVGKVMDEVYSSLLKDFGIETYRGFGIYHDNPKNTPTSELRSDVGCIIENPDEELLKKVSLKFQIKTTPNEEYLVTKFPYKGKLSVIIGVLRVYPALLKHTKKHQLPEEGYVMEIYDVPEKRIVYRKSLQ